MSQPNNTIPKSLIDPEPPLSGVSGLDNTLLKRYLDKRAEEFVTLWLKHKDDAHKHVDGDTRIVAEYVPYLRYAIKQAFLKRGIKWTWRFEHDYQQ